MYPSKKKFDTRTPKVKFVVSVEGGVTEAEYLERIGKLYYTTVIVDIPNDVNHSAPNAVLGRIENYRKKLSKGDQLWCVIDYDRWQDYFVDFEKWVKNADCGIPRYFGLSNPKIELWILLHFSDWDVKAKKRPSIYKLLQKFLPDYDKHLDVKKITKENLADAVRRGMTITPSGNPPKTTEGTNLWVLVKNIMDTALVSGSNDADQCGQTDM